MDNMQEFVITVLMGIGLILAGFLALWLMVVLTKVSKWIDLKLVNVDQALVPFGKSPAGVAVNQYLHGLLSKVDDVSDPFIGTVTGLPYFRKLQEMGIITPEQFTALVAGTIKKAILLTDGVPNVEFTVLKE